jgi:hypothetical protein
MEADEINGDDEKDLEWIENVCYSADAFASDIH